MRFCFKDDPDKYDIDTWCKRECELEYLIEMGLLPVKIERNGK